VSYRVFALLLLLIPSGVRGATDADRRLLDQAAAAFQQGVHARGTSEETKWFRKSATAFEQLRLRGFQSPALLRDEGNARLLANDLPGAILAYRRGLELAPNDRGLRTRLLYARAQVAYPPGSSLGRQPISRWPPWLPQPTPTAGWVVLFCMYGLAWILLGRWWVTHDTKLLTGAGVSMGLAVVIAVGLAWHFSQQHETMTHPLVVIAQDDVYLFKGNGPLYERRYHTPLNRGVEARQRLERHGWLQIELAGGEIGWVPRSAVRSDAS